MTDRYDLLLPRGGAVQPAGPSDKAQRPDPARGEAFAKALEEAFSQTDPVRFSAHAAARLQERGIGVAEAELELLGQAVDELRAKGGRQSLVLTAQSAFVVSVPNRTVVTAMDRASESGRVFTNIDSAIVM